MNALKLSAINTFYNLSHILFDVSLEVGKGESVCLLGRNGAGKTTTLKSIIGIIKPKSGDIWYEGTEITRMKTYQIARLGLGYVPEERIIFPDLSVEENLIIGSLNRRNEVIWSKEKIFEVFPILKKRRTQLGGTLSGGEQQMLTIARSLMGNPRVLLLDEPSEGLAPIFLEELQAQLIELRRAGLALVFCEQNLSFVGALSDVGYILEKGRICWRGSLETLKGAPDIMEKYLGMGVSK